jgi:hypothetical protein
MHLLTDDDTYDLTICKANRFVLIKMLGRRFAGNKKRDTTKCRIKN